MALANWYFRLEKQLLGVTRCLLSNTILMGLLSDTKLASLLKVILKHIVLIMGRPSLLLAVAKRGPVRHAFVHCDLQEEIFMEQPHGFVAQGEHN